MNNIEKPKYWYLTTIESCVLCGVEHKYRERVFSIELKGISWVEYACPGHFM